MTVPAGLNLTNASLTEVIDLLARDLHINYILDPRVKGSVTINTYGEIKAIDLRPLLETILRMNGFQMVQVGNMYRIVPVNEAVAPSGQSRSQCQQPPDDERLILNLVFLKYVTSAEIGKLLEPFQRRRRQDDRLRPRQPADHPGQQPQHAPHHGTDLDVRQRRARRAARPILYPLPTAAPATSPRNSTPIFKAYAFSEKGSGVKFLPVDRINTHHCGGRQPSRIHQGFETGLKKLDVPAKLSAGATDNHVYRLKYGRAEIIGTVIAQLYGSTIPQSSGYGLTSYGGYRGGISGGGMGLNGGGNSRFGAGSGSAFGPSASNSGYSNGGNVFGEQGNATGLSGNLSAAAVAAQNAAAPTSTATPFGASVTPGSADQTGQYLAPGATGRSTGPRIIPNPYDNTLLVQGTPQQWEAILNLLDQLDVPPRQVLIDAKIYEVELTGNLQFGVEATLQAKTAANKLLTGALNPTATFPLTLTAGMLVGRSRELLGVVNALDNKSRARSISAPQLIATDSIPASITVGQEVPTLAATSVSTGLGGSTTSAVQNVGTGVNLNIIARVNASGVVTLVIDQDVSAPQASTFGGINSPSFTRRNVSTQVTVEDGDTIAIGGIILESDSVTSSGLPGLSRLPYIGALFGSKAYKKDRTELIIFLTPHVIYDTNGVAEATEEVKSRMRSLKKDIRNE